MQYTDQIVNNISTNSFHMRRSNVATTITRYPHLCGRIPYGKTPHINDQCRSSSDRKSSCHAKAVPEATPPNPTGTSTRSHQAHNRTEKSLGFRPSQRGSHLSLARSKPYTVSFCLLVSSTALSSLRPTQPSRLKSLDFGTISPTIQKINTVALRTALQSAFPASERAIERTNENVLASTLQFQTLFVERLPTDSKKLKQFISSL